MNERLNKIYQGRMSLQKLRHRELKKYILNIYTKRCKYKNLKPFNEYSNRTINGLVTSLVNISTNMKQTIQRDTLQRDSDQLTFLNNERDYIAFHINSRFLKHLPRNKIIQELGTEIFYERDELSTYHANSSKKSYNGYSHWYILNKDFLKALRLMDRKIIKMIETNEKYESKEYDKVIKQLKDIHSTPKDKTIIDYLKIDKKRFLIAYKKFKEGKIDEFSTMLNNLFYWDDQYVYIDNISKKYKNEDNLSLEGYGREYTVMSNTSKVLRNFLFNEYSEIDMNSAVQTMFINMYYMDLLKVNSKTSLGALENDFPLHYQLLTNKKQFRLDMFSKLHLQRKVQDGAQLVNKYQTDKEKMDIVKTIITHITYSPDSNFVYEYMKDRSPKSKKLFNEALVPFINETKKIKEKILSKYYNCENVNFHYKIGTLRIKDIKALVDEDIRINNHKLRIKDINKGGTGKGIGRGKKLDDRRLFRINTLIEHQVRNKIIAYIQHYTNEEIYQIHDAVIFRGITIKEQFTVKDIQNYIFKELNMRISLELSKL